MMTHLHIMNFYILSQFMTVAYYIIIIIQNLNFKLNFLKYQLYLCI